MMCSRSVFVVAGLRIASSCDRENLADSGPPPLTERRDLLAAPAVKLGIGEDCGPFASSGCSSGLCFKTTASRLDGSRGSRACQTDADCGTLFCLQAYPGEEGWFGLSTAQWDARTL